MLIGLAVRHTDGDSLENSFDTRPFTANTLPAEDPRTTNGPDTNMLDSACDPVPGSKLDDQDGDGFLNASDNCGLR